jgi:Lipocalin-like domain
MKATTVLRICVLGMFCLMCMPWASAVRAETPTMAPSLTGAWTLVAADVLHPDGTRTSDFGAAPKGLLLIDAHGRYSLQIFKAERPHFASGDKLTGTPAEYAAAVLGSSTHFGTISIDPVGGILTFRIENASFPNWEGEQQKRHYELKGDELSYRVPPRPNGDTPISVWQRLK